MQSQSNRIEYIKNKHLTVNKTYPPYIERKYFVKVEPINPIDFQSLQNEIELLSIKDGTRSSPRIYKNKNTNQYYLNYFGSNLNRYLFDITEHYDWEKVFETNKLKDFQIKPHEFSKSIWETRLHYPGSVEYDAIYPPVTTPVTNHI